MNIKKKLWISEIVIGILCFMFGWITTIGGKLLYDIIPIGSILSIILGVGLLLIVKQTVPKNESLQR